MTIAPKCSHIVYAKKMEFPAAKALLVLLAVFSYGSTHGEEVLKPNKDEGIAMGMQTQPLGHGLWVWGTHKHQRSGWSEHRCYIGYRKELKGGSFNIVPMIHLPTLTNSRYEIKIKGEQLVIAKGSPSVEVMRIELVHLHIPKENKAEQ
jgi:hypothetical protein